MRFAQRLQGAGGVPEGAGGGGGGERASGGAASVPALSGRRQREGAALPVPARAGPDGGAGARPGGGRGRGLLSRGGRLDRPLDRCRRGRARRVGADAGAARAAGGLPAQGDAPAAEAILAGLREAGVLG